MMDTLGHVYFVQAIIGGPVKIGFAANDRLERRICELQVGSPLPLKVVALLWTGSISEKRLHDRLAADRLHGEWFAPSEAMRAVLVELFGEDPGTLVMGGLLGEYRAICRDMTHEEAEANSLQRTRESRMRWGKPNLDFLSLGGGAVRNRMALQRFPPAVVAPAPRAPIPAPKPPHRTRRKPWTRRVIEAKP
jgi:hypothetical protein